MIFFFILNLKSVIATEFDHQPDQNEISELCWLYGDAKLKKPKNWKGFFVGPRREMITPWSTNAVEITQNMSLSGILRIEEYFPLIQRRQNTTDAATYVQWYRPGHIPRDDNPGPIKYVDDLKHIDNQEGLALNDDDIAYLHKLEKDG